MKKHLREVIRELPKGAYAEYGHGHIKIRLPNGRFVPIACTPSSNEDAFRETMRKARRELRR